MSYTPENLALALSWRCNISCDHCLVEANSRQTETLDSELIDRLIHEAKLLGFLGVAIYGGEPFLHIKDLLPRTLERILAEGLFVSIPTNGFWGRREMLTKQILCRIETIAATYEATVGIGLSVDQFHQKQIPIGCIANIIRLHKLGKFPHIHLDIQTFASSECHQLVDQVFDDRKKKGIQLFESNDGHDIYPALPEELIEFIPDNYEEITQKLGFPSGYNRRQILQALAIKLKFSEPQDVIARIFDAGKGPKEYLVFPNTQQLMRLICERRIINAGRARKDSQLELSLGYENEETNLVITPNGQAYDYPALVTAEPGVPIDGKSLLQVVLEVGQKRFERKFSSA